MNTTFLDVDVIFLNYFNHNIIVVFLISILNDLLFISIFEIKFENRLI